MRNEGVTYSCDWCGQTVPAVPVPGGALGSPDGWRFVDCFVDGDDLCPDCYDAGRTLIQGAKAARKAGIPVQETVKEDRDHECG